MPYQIFYDGIKNALKECNINCTAMTHCGSGLSLKMAEAVGATGLNHLSHHEHVSLDGLYLSVLPCIAMSPLAVFNPSLGVHFLPCNSLQLPEKLQKMVFPHINEQILRVVLLQDAVFLIEDTP